MNWHWGGRLGDVAQFIRGLTYKPDDVLERDDAGAVPCMRTKNIQEQLEDDDLVYIPDRLVRDGRWLAEGDILVSSANSWNLVGKCSWVPDLAYRATFGGFTSVLRADPRHIDARYLYHWFSWNHTQAVVRSFGQQTTNISNLNHSRCLDLTIPLPPLDEQRRIAAILDKADALRKKRKRAIALLDSLTQSIFLEMFGDPAVNTRWKRARLQEVTSIDAQMVSPKLPQYAELLHYGPDRIEKDTGRLLPALTASEDGLVSGKYLCRPGHVLYSKIRPYLNKVALCETDCLCSADIYPVTAREGIMDRVFLWFILRSQDFLNYAESCSNRANIPKLNRDQFNGYMSIVPPLELQYAFSERLMKIRALTEKADQHLSRADDNFASLQHRAFSGQL